MAQERQFRELQDVLRTFPNLHSKRYGQLQKNLSLCEGKHDEPASKSAIARRKKERQTFATIRQSLGDTAFYLVAYALSPAALCEDAEFTVKYGNWLKNTHLPKVFCDHIEELSKSSTAPSAVVSQEERPSSVTDDHIRLNVAHSAELSPAQHQAGNRSLGVSDNNASGFSATVSRPPKRLQSGLTYEINVERHGFAENEPISIQDSKTLSATEQSTLTGAVYAIGRLDMIRALCDKDGPYVEGKLTVPNSGLPPFITFDCSEDTVLKLLEIGIKIM